MKVIRERGCTLQISKNLAISIGWYKEINVKRTKRGWEERRDTEREEVIDTLVKTLTPGQIQARMPDILGYLNRTEHTLVPIRRIIIGPVTA